MAHEAISVTQTAMVLITGVDLLLCKCRRQGAPEQNKLTLE